MKSYSSLTFFCLETLTSVPKNRGQFRVLQVHFYTYMNHRVLDQKSCLELINFVVEYDS